ncbi:hypothetical protein Lokhon_00574 [Limimaricola hongkongensis DSM 17492]|uniref:Uncharacterized protein n=1 Tax=Limimaricola hongkongensis DSM 17492 TaxID=1122180 RepID=A0A017HH10_9RHOB|nr:hypothetical protein Lokhon_00574 [Limimaricola hongkongensis DSM 17492]
MRGGACLWAHHDGNLGRGGFENRCGPSKIYLESLANSAYSRRDDAWRPT